MKAKDNDSGEQTLKKEKKITLTEREKRANYVEDNEARPSRRENSEAQLDSRHTEKTGTRNRCGRHEENHARRKEDGRSRSKLPLQDKPLTLKDPPQPQSEKWAAKSQVFMCLKI